MNKMKQNKKETNKKPENPVMFIIVHFWNGNRSQNVNKKAVVCSIYMELTQK